MYGGRQAYLYEHRFEKLLESGRPVISLLESLIMGLGSETFKGFESLLLCMHHNFLAFWVLSTIA